MTASSFGFSRRTHPLVVATLVACALAGCDREAKRETWSSPIPFDTTSVVIGGTAGRVQVEAEVAATNDQRAFGLMVRPSLDSMSGMLFTYDSMQGGDRGFWMHRTKIPLDIAFADSTGIIVAILGMDPCDVEDPRACRAYAPGVPYWSALEVNRGFYEKHRVNVGDTIIRMEQQ